MIFGEEMAKDEKIEVFRDVKAVTANGQGCDDQKSERCLRNEADAESDGCQGCDTLVSRP